MDSVSLPFGRPPELKNRFDLLLPEQREQILRFKQFLQVNKYSKGTLKAYECVLINFFEKTKMNALTLDKQGVLDVLSQLPQVNFVTQRRTYSCLNSFLKFFERKDILLDRRQVRGQASDEREIFSIQERDVFFDKAEEMFGIGLRALVEFDYWEALRVNELIEMRVEDVDLQRSKVFVKAGKGNKDATIDLFPAAKTILERYFASKDFKKGQKYLFEYSYKRGKLEGKRSKYYLMRLEDVFQRVLLELGFNKRLTFHSLRHSCASHLLSVGGEKAISKVGKHLRHKKGSPATLVYLHDLEKGFSDSELSKIGGAEK